MSVAGPKARTKPNPRWSNWVPADGGPALIRGLPGWGSLVGVGPPLSWSRPSKGAWPTTLLVPVRVNPVVLWMALKVALTDPSERMSGAAALVLPATTLLDRTTDPPPEASRMPPPAPVAE